MRNKYSNSICKRGKTNKPKSSPTKAPHLTDPLFASKKGATPEQPGVCCLHIHLGKDTQRWHSLSAHCYKPGDLSATTRPAVNWAHFMEPAGDYLQLSAPQCLCAVFRIYLNNFVPPILWIRLNNGLQSARIIHISLQHDIWCRALKDPRVHETNTHLLIRNGIHAHMQLTLK